MTLCVLSVDVNEAESARKSIDTCTSNTSEPTCKLISHLLVSIVPGLTSRMHVESLGKPCIVNLMSNDNHLVLYFLCIFYVLLVQQRVTIAEHSQRIYFCDCTPLIFSRPAEDTITIVAAFTAHQVTCKQSGLGSGPEVIIFFMLNSSELGIYDAHKC